VTGHESEQLRRYLDGEIGRDELPADLQKEADEFDRIVEGMNRRPVKLPRGIRLAVMARIRAGRPSVWSRTRTWFTTPRTIRLSPVGALALAAGLAALFFAVPHRQPAADAESIAHFIYAAPTASRVAVTGEFANWDPRGIAMKRRTDGTWVAEVKLPPGLHQYVFIVDGVEWVPDPGALSQVDDGFGRQNSVLLVLDRKSS
jgi:hypothetical protein